MSYEKRLNIGISKQMWLFLKEKSIQRETSMNSIINECLEKYKKNYEKKLTDRNTNV